LRHPVDIYLLSIDKYLRNWFRLIAITISESFRSYNNRSSLRYPPTLPFLNLRRRKDDYPRGTDWLLLVFHFLSHDFSNYISLTPPIYLRRDDIPDILYRPSCSTPVLFS